MDDLEKNLKSTALSGNLITTQGSDGIHRLRQSSQGLLSRETAQKSILTGLSLISIPLLTWFLLTNPQWGVGIKTNMLTIIYVACLYVFFQIFDRLIFWILSSIFGLTLKTSFVLEFTKFFCTFFTTALYSQEFVMRPVFRVKHETDLSLIIISTSIYASIFAAIFYKFRQMKESALQSKVAQAEAQYNLLESQMQPHFLFNSLNVLSELIYVDPDLANSMTQKMADLYREILHNSKSKFATLESEISILKKYVEIQKIRFGNRVHFETDVSPAFYNLQIPSLMLQTLVENAIKHGISPKKDGGEIYLSVKKVNSLFEVCISNTGVLYQGHTSSKRSTGLQNTKHRLDLTYGNKHQFKIYSDEKRTYVQFRITGRTS